MRYSYINSLLALPFDVTSLGQFVTSLGQCMAVDVVSMTCSDAAKRCNTDVTCRVMVTMTSRVVMVTLTSHVASCWTYSHRPVTNPVRFE